MDGREKGNALDASEGDGGRRVVLTLGIGSVHA
jgi:hypothetical protein